MVSKLTKVQKHITKKKGPKITALHENSRDAQRLRRASARDERVLHKSNTREKANQQWLERIAFFQDRLPETLHPLELPLIQSFISEYLSRHDREVTILKNERRPGRPASNRQVLIEQAIKAEAGEYESGFWVPNLQDEETLVKLDAWKGDWLSLANLRFSRIAKGGSVKESQFPPRGAS